jgi:CRP-like cAMP-binding protein
MPTKQGLKKVSVFKGLTMAELEKLLPVIKAAAYKKGSVIWEEGSSGQGLHIISSGKVKVTRKTKDRGRQVLAVLKKDHFFGELSLLDGRSHSATVETLQNTRLLIIRKKDMDKFLKNNPDIAYKIVRGLSIEIANMLRNMNDKFINMIDYVWD